MTVRIQNPTPPIRLWRVEVSADPASGTIDGETILNTTTSQIKVWYNSQWNVLHTLDISGGLDNLLLVDGTSNLTLQSDTAQDVLLLAL